MSPHRIPKTETIEIQKELFEEGGKLKKYQSLILGQRSLSALIRYELIIGFTSWVPGAMGLLLRSKLYPRLMGFVGKNVNFGQGVVLRHPQKIFIGDNVVIDDYCVLDAKGQDNRGIFIGDGVFLGRNTILNCKNGDIILEDNVNIGFNSMVFSASRVRICRDNLVAAYCYLVGGTHKFDDPMIPVLHQSRESKGISLGPGGWLGAHVTVFDGMRIGKHCILAAGSIVNKDIPDYTIAGGAPVRVIKHREVEESESSKPSVSVGIINYNGEKVIVETIESVLEQDYFNIKEIWVTDDCSKDNSIQIIQEKYSQVQILKSSENRGPNFGRNQILKSATSDYVLLMDNDIILSKNVVSLLVESFQQYPGTGISSAQIRFFHNPDQIQYNGVHIHFIGGASMNSYELEKPMKVSAVSGGTFLVDRSKAIEIGLFDEDFYSGWEDGDFTFRMHIAGYPVLNVSNAKVYHKQVSKELGRLELQIRNRWWFVLKNYHWRTIIVLLPAFLINQLSLFIFSMFKGQIIPFFKGNWGVIISFPKIIRKRKAVMAIKKLKDKQALTSQSVNLLGYVQQSMIIRIGIAVLNGFYSCYWMIARLLVK